MGVGAHRDFEARNPERRIRLWSYELEVTWTRA
jgi:hypothetical protein